MELKLSQSNQSRRWELDQHPGVDSTLDLDRFLQQHSLEVQHKPPLVKSSVKLSDILPLNLAQQRDMFLQDPTYNPKFFYSSPEIRLEESEPDTSLLKLAERILQKSVQVRFAERVSEGPKLTVEQTRNYFERYINQLQLEQQIKIVFKKEALVRTSVVHNNRTEISKIIIRDPVDYNKQNITGVLNHQIGTHIVRKFNQRLQIFYKRRSYYQLSHCPEEEEGLACLNQTLDLLNHQIPPLLFLPALRYYASAKARQFSFSQLYEDLRKYVSDDHQRWTQVVRVKRGLTDTSQLRGMFKDQIYLIGAVRILLNRDKIDLVAMHSSKIGIEDCQRFLEYGALSLKEMRLPVFLREIESYREGLQRIAAENFVQEMRHDLGQ